MPNKKIELKKVLTTKLSSKVNAPKVIKVPFSKKEISTRKFDKSLKDWKKDLKKPKAKVQTIRLKHVAFTKTNLKKFVNVRQTNKATAALDKYYKNDFSNFVSISHSTQMVLSYSTMKDEYIKRYKKARTSTEKKKLKKQWKNIVDAAILVNKISYGESVNETQLNSMALKLKKDKPALREVKNLVKSIKKDAPTETLSFATNMVAYIAPATVATWAPTDIIIPVEDNLCDTPISGVTTRHYSNSFSIKVHYTYWCPTWSSPGRTCRGSVTLAGVSFSMGIEVFYEVSCCGAIAGGSAYVNACGTIIGITKCAGCSANVVALAGIGHAPHNNECRYGFGARADIKCKIGSYTVFSAVYNFGLIVDGPCPPDSLPC